MWCCSTPGRSIMRWNITASASASISARSRLSVLSHGHWDHGGGLLKAFELIQRGITAADDADLSASRHVRRAWRAPAGRRRAADGAAADARRTGDGGRRTRGHRRATAPARRHVLSERRNTARDGVRNRPAQPGPAQCEWRLGTRPVDHGRALPRRRGEGQGRRRVHRMLACRRGERADPCARLLSGPKAVRGDGWLPSVRRNRALHSGDGARSDRLRPERDRARSLHRLARAEPTGADLRRRQPWCRLPWARSSHSEPRSPRREPCRTAVRRRHHAGRPARLDRVRKPDLRRGVGEPHDGHRLARTGDRRRAHRARRRPHGLRRLRARDVSRMPRRTCRASW